MADWSKAKDGIVTEILKDSETYLTGTVTIATSADQRAAVVAGTFATAGAAIVAGVIGFAAAGESRERVCARCVPWRPNLTVSQDIWLKFEVFEAELIDERVTGEARDSVVLLGLGSLRADLLNFGIGRAL